MVLALIGASLAFSACNWDEKEKPRDGFDRKVRFRMVNNRVEVMLPAYTIATVTYNGQQYTVNSWGVATFPYVAGVKTAKIVVDDAGTKESKEVEA